MNENDWEVVKQGTWLYSGEVVCDVRIVKHGWRYGSGDYEDGPEFRDDKQGTFFYIQYGSTTERNIFPSQGSGCDSLAEAMSLAYSQTQGTVEWLD